VTGVPSQVDVEATNAIVISLLEALDANKRGQPAFDEPTVVAAPLVTPEDHFEDGASALAEPANKLPRATFESVQLKAGPDLLADLAHVLDQAWPPSEQVSEERHALPLRRRLAR
jgi:hypothetical protein